MGKGKKIPVIDAVTLTTHALSTSSESELTQAIFSALRSSSLTATARGFGFGLHKYLDIHQTQEAGLFQLIFYASGPLKQDLLRKLEKKSLLKKPLTKIEKELKAKQEEKLNEKCKTLEIELREVLLSIPELRHVGKLFLERCEWGEGIHEKYDMPFNEWYDEVYPEPDIPIEAECAEDKFDGGEYCSDGSYFPEAYLYRDDDRPLYTVWELFAMERNARGDDWPLEFSSEELKELRLRKTKLANQKGQWKYNHPPHGLPSSSK